MGEGRFHPFFETELRYDSAAGYFGQTGGAPQLSPEYLAYLRPGVTFEVNTPATSIDVSGAAEYVLYTGLVSAGARAASRLQGGLGLKGSFNRNGGIGLELSDNFVRSDRTSNAAVGIGVVSLLNDARLSVPFHPGGRALDITPTVGLAIERFEPISKVTPVGCPANDVTCRPDLINQMDYNSWSLGAAARWRFFPKTAIIISSGVDLRQSVGAASFAPARLWRNTAGLAGLLSPRLTAVVTGGYAFDFGGSRGARFVAQAQATYAVSATAMVTAGYVRSLDPVPIYGTFGDDRFLLEASTIFAGRLRLHLQGSYDVLSFYGQSGRSDRIAAVDVGPEYRITSWLTLAGGYTLTNRSSTTVTSEANNFTRHIGYARIRFAY